MNGQVITDADVDQYTKGAGGHKPLADRPKIGHVGLQSHETRVDFRNIEIKDLTTLTPSGLRYVDLVPGTGPVRASRRHCRGPIHRILWSMERSSRTVAAGRLR